MTTGYKWTEHLKFKVYEQQSLCQKWPWFGCTNGKGVYPYDDYITDFSKFDKTEFPSKKAFYSYLYEEDVTHEEYGRAQKVLWTHFNIKNLGEYHDLI